MVLPRWLIFLGIYQWLGHDLHLSVAAHWLQFLTLLLGKRAGVTAQVVCETRKLWVGCCSRSMEHWPARFVEGPDEVSVSCDFALCHGNTTRFKYNWPTIVESVEITGDESFVRRVSSHCLNFCLLSNKSENSSTNLTRSVKPWSRWRGLLLP